MELRELQVIPLKYYYDEILKTGYVKCLTLEKLESFKLPTSPANYKFTHLLSPQYSLKIEVVKTRKNWILKTVQSYHKIMEGGDYADYLKQAEIVKIVSTYIQEEQNVNLLDFFQNYFSQVNLKALDVAHFEITLLEFLGFGDKNKGLAQSKRESGLL